jgi:flagellar biosynthesis/type III secretory pathway protein FliH
MTLTPGRVLKASALGADAERVTSSLQPMLPRGRVAPSALVDAAEVARALLSAAEQRASQVLAAARAEAAAVRLRAEEEGRADGAAAVAAQAIALSSLEALADERQMDRWVELARLLAERLLGAELALDPSRVVALARQALDETRGARQVKIVAHPDDLALLERSAAALGLEPSAMRFEPDADRARGNLRIETEIGVLDAELAPQLERLALKLREAIGS